MSPEQAQAQTIAAIQQQTDATLTAAIITASGRPFSIAETLELLRDIHFGLRPNVNSGSYVEWVKTKDARLSKVYAAT